MLKQKGNQIMLKQKGNMAAISAFRPRSGQSPNEPL
jgi:hypothetical protein